jgi:hypothetical protein
MILGYGCKTRSGDANNKSMEWYVKVEENL